MTQINVQPHRTKVHANHNQIVHTHKGMAHWSGTGPGNTMCCECKFWHFGMPRTQPSGYSGCAPKEAICAKWCHMTPIKAQPRTAPKVPGVAASCRHFETYKKPGAKK